MKKKLLQKQKILLKEKLLSKKVANDKRIIELKQDDPFLDPDHANDNAAVDTDVREQMGHQTVESQIASLQRQNNLIEQALNKIAKDTYGLCERCNREISYKRLELIPEARYCIDCEKRLVK